ncbi:hypothetical protein CPB97_009535 [Podila verticillata]|nr:hypothetical protein CPB97_009535 [Podila verticillata]
MSNPLLEISSKDERLASLLRDEKKTTPIPTPPGERKTFKVQSDLLARLEDFLPKIRDANAELDQKLKEDPKSLDIENVDETSGEQYIEMDLGLGVFDLKKDTTEDDIIINPGTAKENSSTKPPTIVMMDTDKDEDMITSAAKKIPKGSENDEDVIMA